MICSVTQRYPFSASHRLHLTALSDTQNALLYGKCNNPFGHGHDYVLSVTAEGPLDDQTGLIIKRSDLEALVSDVVLSKLRHKNLNRDIPEFADLVPTTENLAAVIATWLQESWKRYITGLTARLARVHIQETDRNGFEILLPAATTNIEQLSNENAVVHA